MYLYFSNNYIRSAWKLSTANVIRIGLDANNISGTHQSDTNVSSELIKVTHMSTRHENKIRKHLYILYRDDLQYTLSPHPTYGTKAGFLGQAKNETEFSLKVSTCRGDEYLYTLLVTAPFVSDSFRNIL